MAFIKRNLRKVKKGFRLIYAKFKFRDSKKGTHVIACRKLNILNSKYITIGNNCYFGPDCRIEAWDQYNNDVFSPQIIFGEDVRINSTCHIGAINKIVIGDQCLFGSHVMIIDHSHGRNTIEELELHPSNRNLYSKGEIIIGKRCWICENAVILPNVHIGDGCIIGANSVVTKNIPANSVVGGNPARVLKTISKNPEQKGTKTK